MIEAVVDHADDDTPDEAAMRRHIRRDALQIALRYWYDCMPLDECHAEMWLAGVRAEQFHLGKRDFKLKRITDSEVDAQIAWVGEYHEESYQLMIAAAAAALVSGRDKVGVMQAAVDVARGRAPLPAPYIVEQAVAKAGRAHRFDERWWQKRGRTG